MEGLLICFVTQGQPYLLVTRREGPMHSAVWSQCTEIKTVFNFNQAFRPQTYINQNQCIRSSELRSSAVTTLKTAAVKMRTSLTGCAILVASTLIGLGQAQKCAGTGKGKPHTVAKGFTSYVLASGLSGPRGLVFDKEGHLLVVEKTSAGTVTAIKLKEEGGCVSVASKATTGASGPGGLVGHLLYLQNARRLIQYREVN